MYVNVGHGGVNLNDGANIVGAVRHEIAHAQYGKNSETLAAIVGETSESAWKRENEFNGYETGKGNVEQRAWLNAQNNDAKESNPLLVSNLEGAEKVENPQAYWIEVETNKKTNKGEIKLYSEEYGSREEYKWSEVMDSLRVIPLNAKNDAQIGGWTVLSKGQHRNQMKENGDSPEGIYKVDMSRILGGIFGERAVPTDQTGAYGTGYIGLSPITGFALESRRTGISIHGGGTNLNLIPDPYADKQKLINTPGCFRMRNMDVNDLISNLKILNAIEKIQTNTVEFKRVDQKSK
jgi:hypothetical protein